MNIIPIHDSWGSIVRCTPKQFFDQPNDFWRTLIYDRKLIIFKQLEFHTHEEQLEGYIEFALRFGKPWANADYKYSHEKTLDVNTNRGVHTVSPFSNLLLRGIGMGEMLWHADIPNRSYNPFPFRSLWIKNNPNNESGLTTFLNIEEGLHLLRDDLKQMLPDITIVQQSWYKQDTDIQHFPPVKKHPITGQNSLRVNYYNQLSKKVTNAWIKYVIHKGHIDPECNFVANVLTDLTQHSRLKYTHKWDVNDLLIYDNWPLVHNRTKLEFDPTQERFFYRMNIDHVDHNLWIKHKQEFFNEH